MIIESALLFQAHSIRSRGRRGDWRQGLTKTTLADPANPHTAQDSVARLIALREAIARRARDCGRAPESIKLVAVSKTFSADEVWPTIAIAGQIRFGENRVQEAISKWRDLRPRAARLGKTIELHLIGPLQSNKAREAIETFDVIETVDREKIAAALAREIDRVGKRPRLFVEVNTGGEPQKAGVLPENADAFIALCRDSYGLTIDGLMAIPPADEPASPHFALLGVIAERNGLRERSMGMSADWPLAVQLGATYVRLGSAIFGSRG
jgi:PLP dependent protein